MKDYIAAAIDDNEKVELVHIDDGVVTSGIYDSLECIIRDVERMSGTGNLYLSLNKSSGRVVNNALGGRRLKDSDISDYKRLVFDFDPKRPSGTASTDEELLASKKVCDSFIAKLTGMGWPEPLVAMSGNGYHAVYRVSFRVTTKTKSMLKMMYLGLKEEFSTESVEFDSTVRNPSRILRLYGTVNRKGENSLDRPHRVTSYVIPEAWSEVPNKLVEALAGKYEDRILTLKSKPIINNVDRIQLGCGDYTTLDVVGWFDAHGMYQYHIEGNVHSVRCPWEEEHTTSSNNDTVIFEADGGWAGFACKHAHCEGRDIRDVMALLGDADAYCHRLWRG